MNLCANSFIFYETEIIIHNLCPQYPNAYALKLRKRLNFNPKALVRGACGLGTKRRALNKLGRSISY